MAGKMIGCRLSEELDKIIRAKAVQQNKSVNQFLVDTLKNAVDNPGFETAKLTENSNDIIRRIREIKAQIDELEESKIEVDWIDKGFLGLGKSGEELLAEEENKPTNDTIELLKLEMEQLVGIISEKKNSILNHLASHRKVHSNQEQD